MKLNIKNVFARLRRSEEGATLVEYGIALGLAVTVGAGALLALGNDVDAKMTAASGALKGEETTTTP
ncbi:hypothetical protein K3757_15700 [Sulfitobacter sp. S223]|uniref:Flp family type IVb pilin n=1 Tax=Sulfitobacter sp. S223 TaxID=2867023 RepID=UPI0021A4BD2C|nr:hypothetical protein [Sulfitobacter sp. S223]UWR25883.1 hypothetical protein K3757_15700 [Sulfitobacter sp. S223]